MDRTQLCGSCDAGSIPAGTTMKKLVFICHGNSFRSPIAEGIFNHNPKNGWIACSYGTAVEEQKTQGLKLSESPYNLSIVIDEMKKLGIDISEKYCNQLFLEYLDDVNKVIVMTEIEFIPEWLAKKNYERWEIPNPETYTNENVEEVISLLTEKIEILKKNL